MSNETTPAGEWKWYGLAGHFIGAASCRFHMATEIGDYLVSSVGDYYPRDAEEAQDIGYGRKFETFVFKTNGTRCDCGCGMPGLHLCELLSEAANTAEHANRNHIEVCDRIANGERP